MRLLAALQVAFVHAVEWLAVPVPRLLMQLIGLFPGVTIFFAISGYLVTDAYLRSSIRAYAVNRGLRIYPALWASVLVCAGIAEAFGEFRGVSGVEIAAWIVGTMTFLQHTSHFLRDFATGSINGVLWTITVELQFYLLLPFILWYVDKSGRRFAIVFAAALSCGVAYLFLHRLPIGNLLQRLSPSWIYVFLVGVFVRLNPAVVAKLRKV